MKLKYDMITAFQVKDLVMPIGNTELTDISNEQVHSVPGMAHFAGTGPSGTYCATCSFLVAEKHSVYCEKYKEIMHRRGNAIRGGLRSCKYYVVKPSAEEAL
jgi:hypothetical protein